MGANNTNQSAKGIYTFTQKEEVEYTYGVVASSWEEAKEKIANYDFAKIEAGDFMGGEYLGHTKMRRKELIRKQSCTAENFTLMKKVKLFADEKTTTHYTNCTISSSALVADVNWRDELPSDLNNFSQYDEKTGCCAECSAKLRNGYAMIPRIEAPENIENNVNGWVGANYTRWEVKE